MITRAWFLICVLWALFFLGIRAVNGSSSIEITLGVAFAPVIAGFALYYAIRFIIFGVPRPRPKVRIFRP